MKTRRGKRNETQQARFEIKANKDEEKRDKEPKLAKSSDCRHAGMGKSERARERESERERERERERSTGGAVSKWKCARRGM